MVRGKTPLAVRAFSPSSARSHSRPLAGWDAVLYAVKRVFGRVRIYVNMSTLKKTLKAGAIAGICGLGVCALARKLKLSSRLAELLQNIEVVPFPGTRLYAFLASRQLRPLYAEVAEEIIEEVQAGRILDLGTGPGYLPMEIVQRNPSAQVVGVDPSGDMVRIAKANATASHTAKLLEFVLGDPTDLPFPGRYFDFAVSVNVLHHWRNPLAVLEEVYHVLIPGGHFWIYDFRKEVPQETWESLSGRLPMYLRPMFQLGPLASWKAAYGERDLMDMAARTHFEGVTAEPKTLTLFGQPMPTFTRWRLTKPKQAGE